MTMILGTAADDVLVGTQMDDIIDGGAGSDIIDGSFGADALRGGLGNDLFRFSAVRIGSASLIGLIDGGGDFDTIDFRGVSPVSLGTIQVGTNYVLGAFVGSQRFEIRGVEQILFGNADNRIAIPSSFTGSIDVRGGGGNDDFTVSGSNYAYGEVGDDTFFLSGSFGTPPVNGVVHGGSGLDVLKLNILFDVDLAAGTAASGSASYLVGSFEHVMAAATGGYVTTVRGSGASEFFSINPLFNDGATGVVFEGRGGDDHLAGSLAGDTLDGGAGSDTIDGDVGDDLIDGGEGADTMTGGLGRDVYVVDNAADLVVEMAGGGVDLVRSSITYTLGAVVENLTLTGAAAISATGNSLANTLVGNAAANAISGGDGNDFLDGGAGADILYGGAGNDTYVVDSTGDKVRETSATGGDDLVRSLISSAMGANIERLTLTGTASLNGYGNALANVITGNSGANRLDGRAGADSMIGGAGNDIYVVDDAGDEALETSATGGDDVVKSSVSYTIGANVERLVLSGSGSLNGTGNTLANIITGNADVNQLDGLDGADRMYGGAGNDTYVIDNSGDRAFEAATGGDDLVQSSISYAIGGNVERLTLTGEAATNGVGNGLANVITGNGAANRLDGRVGADSLYGGAGNDTYVIDNAGDKAIESSPAGGDDLVQSSVGYAIGANVERLVLSGSAAINGYGNALANIIGGNGGANLLRGGAGNDFMTAGGGADRVLGGTGNDRLTGGAGADSFYFDTELDASVNLDTLLDFVAAEDSICLDRSIFAGIIADGSLSEAAFQLGTASQDADDRILYDQATGSIYYDADGLGGAAAVLFAGVSAGTDLSAADFIAIA